MDWFFLDFILEIYGIKIMNNDRILLDIKRSLVDISQSLYNLSLDINKITKKIIEEDEKAEKENDKRRIWESYESSRSFSEQSLLSYHI